MKNKRLYFIITFLAAFLLTFSGCKKDISIDGNNSPLLPDGSSFEFNVESDVDIEIDNGNGKIEYHSPDSEDEDTDSDKQDSEDDTDKDKQDPEEDSDEIKDDSQETSQNTDNNSSDKTNNTSDKSDSNSTGNDDSSNQVSDNGSNALNVTEDGEYTSKEEVALYIHTYKHLPSNYITKNEAKKLGWDSKSGNLAEACPGKSIGGDKFGNREGLLPEKDGRQYYECDIDYVSGTRNGKRIVFSNDGLIYYTEDHYNTYELLYE